MRPGEGHWRHEENDVWRWHGVGPPQAEEKPWRQQFAMLAIAICTIVVLPLAATFFAYRSSVNARTADNKAAIVRESRDAEAALARERRLRIAVTNELKARDARNCRYNEIRDTVVVAQLRAAQRRARASLPAGSAELRYQLQVLEDGINVLEPPGEIDCPPFPPGYGP